MTFRLSPSISARPQLPVTVIVLAHDEERNIASCLDSLQTAFTDVHVLDSGSTDATVDLAIQAGADVHYHPFTGFGKQRNWAIDNIPHKFEWSLHLDADERSTPEFESELRKIFAREPTEAGFFVPSKLMLNNCWLRRSSGFPVYQVRLFHREKLRFDDHGHGQREVTSGNLGYMREPYLHFAFSKGLQHWFEKHARYAADEATSVGIGTPNLPDAIKRCFSYDPIIRRRALKQLSFRLPARSLLRQFELLVINRGILDGRAGITYARMMGVYEAMLATYLSAKRDGFFDEELRR